MKNEEEANTTNHTSHFVSFFDFSNANTKMREPLILLLNRSSAFATPSAKTNHVQTGSSHALLHIVVRSASSSRGATKTRR